MSDQYQFTNDPVAWDDWLQQEGLDEPSCWNPATLLSATSPTPSGREHLDPPFAGTQPAGQKILHGPGMSDSGDHLLEGQQTAQYLANHRLEPAGESSTTGVEDSHAANVGEKLPSLAQRLLYPESTCASCSAPLDTSELSYNDINPNIYCTRNRATDHLSLRCVQPGCGRKFNSLANLKSHFNNTIHDSFYCAIPECRELLWRGSVQYHFVAVHKDIKYRCAQCGIAFDTSHQLDGHGKDTMHSAYVCRYPECGSESTRYGEMSRHHLSHQQSVPRHPCPHCRKYRGDNGFKRKDHLRQHIRNYHHIDVDAQNPNIDESAVHPCPFEGCDKTNFQNEKLMKVHLKKEHPSPYQCSYPGCHRVGTNGWMRERDMVKHMKKDHNI